jgi:hypothetical protein
MKSIVIVKLGRSIETESDGTLYIDRECIETFLETGRIEDFLGNLQIGFDTLAETTKSFSSFYRHR